MVISARTSYANRTAACLACMYFWFNVRAPGSGSLSHVLLDCDPQYHMVDVYIYKFIYIYIYLYIYNYIYIYMYMCMCIISICIYIYIHVIPNIFWWFWLFKSQWTIIITYISTLYPQSLMVKPPVKSWLNDYNHQVTGPLNAARGSSSILNISEKDIRDCQVLSIVASKISKKSTATWASWFNTHSCPPPWGSRLASSAAAVRERPSGAPSQGCWEWPVGFERWGGDSGTSGDLEW